MKKRKMKGGGDVSTEMSNLNKSSYNTMTNKLFLNFIFCIALMGFIWFFVSTFLVKHMYSEVLCYSMMLMSIVLSLFLMMSIGVIRMQGDNFIKKTLNIVMFVITKCLPGILIAVQLGAMIYIMNQNALYLHTTDKDNRPEYLNIFNGSAALGLIIQMWMYRNHLYKIILPDGKPNSPAVLPGFILAGILTSWCITQIFVILKFLKVDG